MVDNNSRRKLVDYIKKNLKKNYPLATLTVALINQGYTRPIIDEAAREAIKELALEAPIIKDKPEIEHEIITDEPVVEKQSFWKKIAGWFGK
ncbi:hypothetical protein M0R19_06940 [Candidatus Pacearchaeota archaeon]|jgi:hypothetical protein|nr:hypothetical protein [Candidatus Pacearchaeota archaeon]